MAIRKFSSEELAEIRNNPFVKNGTENNCDFLLLGYLKVPQVFIGVIFSLYLAFVQVPLHLTLTVLR